MNEFKVVIYKTDDLEKSENCVIYKGVKRETVWNAGFYYAPNIPDILLKNK